MSVFDDPGNGLINDLHAAATRLEQGGHMPFYKCAALLRKAQHEIDRMQNVPVSVDRVVYVGTERANAAVHSLHEQAHGPVPFKTCQSFPCKDLAIDVAGPAPLSLPLVGAE